MFKVVRIEISCADRQCFRCCKFPWRVPSPSQSTAHCCDKDKSVHAKVWNNVHIHSSLHKLTNHDDKLPTFSAFWFEIVEVSSRF